MTNLSTNHLDVRTATIIPLPTKHEPCFTDVNLNSISVLMVMEACLAMNHALLMAKSPIPTKAQYEFSLAILRRSIASLPFHQEKAESTLWVQGLCEPLYYHGVDEQVPTLLWEETEIEDFYLPTRGFCASFCSYARRLTAQLGKILYNLPKAEFRENLALSASAYEQMIVQPYLRYLGWALPQFEDALSKEAYTLTAYPFAMPAIGAQAENPAEDPADGCEIICTEFVPTLTLYHVWNAAKEEMETCLFENGTFRSFAGFGLDSIFDLDFGADSEGEILSPIPLDEEIIAFPYDTENAAYFTALLDLFVECVDEADHQLLSAIYGDGSAVCAALYEEETEEDPDQEAYDAQTNIKIAALFAEDFDDDAFDDDAFDDDDWSALLQ